MNIVRKAYRSVVDHLTKALGVLGTVWMTVLGLDPGSIREAAETYLGHNAAVKIGGVLFALVIIRGWYTGRKARQIQGLPAPAKETQRP